MKIYKVPRKQNFHLPHIGKIYAFFRGLRNVDHHGLSVIKFRLSRCIGGRFDNLFPIWSCGTATRSPSGYFDCMANSQVSGTLDASNSRLCGWGGALLGYSSNGIAHFGGWLSKSMLWPRHVSVYKGSSGKSFILRAHVSPRKEPCQPPPASFFQMMSASRRL